MYSFLAIHIQYENKHRRFILAKDAHFYVSQQKEEGNVQW